MDLAICIAIKNRSNLLVSQEDPIKMYAHIADKIEPTPSNSVFSHIIRDNGLVELQLLPNLLNSLILIKRPEDKWTIILIDYESTDVDLEKLCSTLLNDSIPYFLHTIKGAPSFNRGGGLHLAAKIAKSRGHTSLFFCDTDMFFTDCSVFDQAQRSLEKGRIYYPICFSFIDPIQTKGYWRDSGFGMLFIRTDDYFSTKGWMNNRSWGWEDRDFYESIPKTQIDRSRASGYFHQWHPNDISFKTTGYSEKQFIGHYAIY